MLQAGRGLVESKEEGCWEETDRGILVNEGERPWSLEYFILLNCKSKRAMSTKF